VKGRGGEEREEEGMGGEGRREGKEGKRRGILLPN